ncbi:MAG: serine hydrolase [Promethearchaeota archaeon]
MSSENFDHLVTLIMEMLAKFKVPGMAVSVVKGNNVIFERGFGYRNMEQFLPMTENTLIGIGSVAKSFTAIAILQLQEKGLLNIEDPIVKFFPWFPQNPDNPIKIKHLMSHSTGFPSLDGTTIEYLHHEKRHIDFTPITSRQDLEWYIKNGAKERLFDPGEKFFYNNDMYIMLQYLIEDVTGVKFVDYMKENIFKPLGMNRTCYTSEDVKNDPLHDSSTGYKFQDKNLVPIMHLFSEFLYGGGGILSSAHEMTNYIKFVIEKGKYGKSQLLKEEIAALLWKPVIKGCPYTYKREGEYCLGWMKEEKFGTTLIKHGGGLSSSTTALSILPEKQIGVFAIENDMKGACSMVVDAILAIMTGNDYKKLPFFKYRELVSTVEGTYKSYRGLYSMKVELKGPMLMVHLEIDDGEFDIPIVVRDPENLIFTIPAGFPDEQRKICFIRDKETGKVIQVIFDRYLYHRT